MRNYDHLKSKVREVKNFPTPGISFKDITPLLKDKHIFREIINGLTTAFKHSKADKVVGIDARGFVLSAPVAYLIGAGKVIVRKKGKLPHKKIAREHDLEYGKGVLEIHIDAIEKGEKVLIIDDVLATGGTCEAAVRLVEDLGGEIVGLGFLLELPLGGRERLKKYPIHSLITY
jgi:adenine phosphoribosyltransferase